MSKKTRPSKRAKAQALNLIREGYLEIPVKRGK